MKRKKIIYLIAVAVLSFGMLAGCSNGKKEDQTAYRQIGINKMESGDYEAAVSAFDNALSQCVGKIGENELDICYYKAAAQYEGGDVEGAIATYTAILEYDKKAADAYYLRGCMYLKEGDADAAVADYEKAVSYNSEDYDLYINLYNNLSAYGMKEKGEEYLNKAFSIKGNSKEDYTARGHIYYLLGQYDNASEELSQAVEKGSTEACLYLAQTYEALGDSENAEANYQKYVDSGAADSYAMNALAKISIAKGDYAAALSYIEQGLAMDTVTNRRELMQNEIIAYEYSGDFQSAWKVVQDYVESYPDDESAQREYIFLKNRIDPNAVEGDVVQTEEEDTVSDTEQENMQSDQ